MDAAAAHSNLLKIVLGCEISQTLEEICETFFTELSQVLPLSYAVVGITNGQKEGVSIIHQFPKVSRQIDQIAQKLAPLLGRKRYIAVQSDQAAFKDICHDKRIRKGSYHLFALPHKMLLLLYSASPAFAFPNKDISLYRAVFKHLANTLHCSQERQVFHQQIKELTHEKEQYERITKNISEGIIISDLDNNITFANRRISEMSGYPLSEIIGKKTDAILIHRDTVQSIENKIKKSFTGKEVLYEVEHNRKDSNQYWCAQTRVSPFKDKKGNILGAIGIITNITELKLAQKALKESEERYRLLFEHGFDGIILFDSQLMKPLKCNNQVLKYFNCTQEEFLNASPLDLSPEFQEDGTSSKEARARLMEKLRKDKQIRFEWIHQLADGSLLDTEIQTFTLPKPFDNLRISVLKDISERKRNEKVIRESEARLSLALDAGQLGTWDWNMKTGETIYNRRWAEMLGYELEEIKPVDTSFDELVHPEDLHLVRDAVQKHLAGNTPYFETEIRMISKSGEIKWIYDRGKITAFDESNQPSRSTGIHVDLTQIKQYELEIKKSEERFRKLFEHSPFGIILRDAFTAEFRQVNQKACEIFGYSKEELLQQTRDNLIHAEDSDYIEKENQLLLKGEISSFSVEKQYRKKNGDIFWALTTRSVVEVEGQTHIIGFIEDISKRKAAEAALQESSSRIKEAQQLANLGNWEFDLVSNKIDWSEGTLRIFGYRIGADPPDFETYKTLVHPDDLEMLMNAVSHAAEVGESYELEVRHFTNNGRMIYTLCKGKPLAREGKIVKIFGTVQDISQQKIADQVLHETNKKYRDLFENMYDALIVTDEAGRFVDANKAAQTLLGYPLQELTQIRIPDIVHPEDVEKSQAYLTKLITKGFYSNYQGRIITKQGGVKYLQVNSNAILGKEGQFGGSRDIARDITALKVAEDKREQLLFELEEVNRELKDFAYVVSHDLKAPLRAISSLAQWLAEDYNDKFDENGKLQLRLLISRVSRMHNFIEGILEYSRIGRISNEKEEVPIDTLLNEIMDSLSPPNTFTLKVSKNLPTLFTDKLRMEQLFQNLISNAIKYNDKKKGWVKISYKALPEFHHFKVQDNGIGIESRYFEKIFHIFQTLQARDKYESTGIGLTIVKRIVQLYGGHIELQSIPGKGTTFEFTLKK